MLVRKMTARSKKVKERKRALSATRDDSIAAETWETWEMGEPFDVFVIAWFDVVPGQSEGEWP